MALNGHVEKKEKIEIQKRQREYQRCCMEDEKALKIGI
jgi:hypothetical protein